MRVFIASLAASMTLSGCARVVESVDLDTMDRASKLAPGVVYALPKELYKVTLTHSKVRGYTAEQLSERAELKKEINDQKAKLKAEAAKLKKDSSEQEKKKIEAAKAAIQGKINKAQAALKEMEQNTPRVPALQLNFSDAIVIPDETAEFRLEYAHWANSNDTIAIKVDERGLLQSIDTSTSDRTGAIITQAVKLAADTYVFFGTGGFGQPSVGPKLVARDRKSAFEERRKRFEKHLCSREFTVTTIVDPARPEEFEERLNEAIGARTGSSVDCVKLEVLAADDPDAAGAEPAGTTKPKTLQEWTSALRERAKPGKNECGDGACYRTRGSITLQVVHLFPEFVSPAAVVVHAAQLGRLGLVDFNRRAFVDATAKAEFANGMLKSVSYTDPSEIEGFLKIPTDILGHIFGLPAKMFETETGKITAEKDLVAAQTALEKEKAGLLEQQRLLEKQRALDAEDTVAPQD